MAQQDSPIWKNETDLNKYRDNELYRRFRSMCYEMARKSVNADHPEFERRVAERYAQIQQEFTDE